MIAALTLRIDEKIHDSLDVVFVFGLHIDIVLLADQQPYERTI